MFCFYIIQYIFDLNIFDAEISIKYKILGKLKKKKNFVLIP